MRKLDGHKNVVKLLAAGMAIGKRKFVIVMELGTVNVWSLVKRKRPMSTANCQRLIMHICRAIVFLNDNGIVHKDIKPENFIGVGSLDGKEGTTPCGLPPEAVSNDLTTMIPADAAIDVFGAGCALLRLLSPLHRFPIAGQLAVVDFPSAAELFREFEDVSIELRDDDGSKRRIVWRKFKAQPLFGYRVREYIDRRLSNIVYEMVVLDKRFRISIEAIAAHPLIRPHGRGARNSRHVYIEDVRNLLPLNLRNLTTCSEETCSSMSVIRCSHCSSELCFKHFFVLYHVHL